MKFSITTNGVELDPSLYTWDPETKTLSTNEDHLVFDFNDLDGITFNAKYTSIFKTGRNCNFDVEHDCTFDTGSGCKFDTGDWCVFDTIDDCIFKTGDDCNFDTGLNGEFDTGNGCTIIIRGEYDKEIKHGKKCVAIIRKDDESKIEIIDLDEPKSIRFLKEE